MNPLIQKELRDHGAIAVLLAAAVGLLLLRSFSGGNPAHIWNMLSSDSTRLLLFAVSSVGLAFLGASQGSRERLEGSWPFLLHRPIARGRIVASKMLAAFLMAVLSLLLPSAALFTWALQGPRPVDPIVLLQSGLYLAAGIPFYFAALSASAMETKRRATGLLLFGWPVLMASLLFMETLTPGAVTALIAFTSVVYGALAYRVLTAPEAQSTRSFQILTLAGGVLALQSIGLLLLPTLMVYPAAEANGSDEEANDDSISLESLRWLVTNDGAVVGIRTERNDAGESMVSVMRSPEGESLPLPTVPYRDLGASLYGPTRRFDDGILWSRTHRYLRIPQHGEIHDYEWYFDRRESRFVGYENEGDGRRYLGPEGFTDEPASAFSGAPIDDARDLTGTLVFADGAYQVDWDRQRWTPIVTRSDRLWGTEVNLDDNRMLFGDRALHLVDGNGRVRTLPRAYPNESAATDDAHRRISVGFLSQGGYFLRERADRTVAFSFFDSEGNPTQRIEVPTEAWSQPPREGLFGGDTTYANRSWLSGLTHPLAFFGSLAVQQGTDHHYRLGPLRNGWTPLHLQLAGLLALLALFGALLLTRRWPMPARVALAVVCILLGPSALLLCGLRIVPSALRKAPNQTEGERQPSESAKPPVTTTDPLAGLLDPQWTGL